MWNCLIGIVKGCIGCIYRNQKFREQIVRAYKKEYQRRIMENEDFLRSTGHGREERHEDTRKLVSSRDDSHQEHNLIIRSKVSQLSFSFFTI